MRFSGVTLASVTPDKIDRSVQILSRFIYFGVGDSNRIIRFGALVTFCVLIDSLYNVFFQILVLQISPLIFFLSLYYSGSLGASS